MVHMCVSWCLLPTAALQRAIITSSGESRIANIKVQLEPNRTYNETSKAALGDAQQLILSLPREAQLRDVTVINDFETAWTPSSRPSGVYSTQESIRAASLAATMFILCMYLVMASLQRIQARRRCKIQTESQAASGAAAAANQRLAAESTAALTTEDKHASASSSAAHSSSRADQGCMCLEMSLPLEVPAPTNWNLQLACSIKAVEESKNSCEWPELIVVMSSVDLDGQLKRPALEVRFPAAGQPRLLDVDADMKLTQADGSCLGQLQPIGCGRYILQDSNGVGTLAVSCNPTGNFLEIGCLPDGRKAAVARREDSGQLSISVYRSTDPALALACTLAVLLLAPLKLWQQGFSSLSLASLNPCSEEPAN